MPGAIVAWLLQSRTTEKEKEVEEMAIIRWTPLRHMMSFRDEMDRLLSDFYGKVTPTGESYEGDWLPAMDLAETDDDVTACLELPGLKKEDIKVSVHNDILTVSGEKKQEWTEEKENIHRVERVYGSFRRSIRLPGDVDGAKVKATFKDGVLKVTLPKHEAKKPKEIPIQVS
jgi:HSP20 family protein